MTITTHSCFIPFNRPIEGISLPISFTYPFNYQPHPLAVLASEELQQYLKSIGLHHELAPSNSNMTKTVGKMFGVLIVKNPKNELGYLAAFSGKLADKNLYPPFVPPVYDRLTKDGFFLSGEEELNEINQQVKELEQAENYLVAKQQLENANEEASQELLLLKEKIRIGKEKRKEQRIHAAAQHSEKKLQQLNAQLSKKSQDEQRSYKRAAKRWKAQLHELQLKVNSFEQTIQQLKDKRKTYSAWLQHRLFAEYKFLNRAKETKTLVSIFKDTPTGTPPAGAGDCAAPKLLNYAFQNNLTPLCMAEFWWGVSPIKEIRKHNHYYPACKSKCEPILGHMLSGMQLDPNPVSIQLSKKKKVEIVFEDDYIIVVNKPEGMLSVPGKENAISLQEYMKDSSSSNSGPFLVHRLDMSTSGLLLLAKEEAYYKQLQQQFTNRTVQKRYVALLDGVLATTNGTIHLPLRVDLDNRPHQLVCHEYGKQAVTHWKVIHQATSNTRIHFFPVTGRTHQLRVHADHQDGLNCSIKGDELYGTSSDRLYLHAEYLSFRHPVTNKHVDFYAPPDF